MTTVLNLRDENPIIDSDLELIIDTFERSMVLSRDEDSVLAILPRQLMGMKVVPDAIIRTTETPPRRNKGASAEIPDGKRSQVPGPDSLGDPAEPEEDGEEDQDWKDLAKKWANECIPCDLRKLTVPEVDFYGDLEDAYNGVLGQFEDTLDNLEGLVDGGLDNIWDTGGNEVNPFDINEDTGGTGEDFFSQFCDIGDSLKDQCVPDLNKLKFILSMLLERNELEILPELNLLDSLIMQSITPLINQMLANISTVLDLGIGPIQCVVNHIQSEIERVTDGVRDTERLIANTGDSVRAGRRSGRNSSQSASEESAFELARRSRASAQQRSEERAAVMPRAAERVAEGLDGASGNGAGMQRLKGLVQQGINYVRQKARWLSNLFEELVGNGLDDLNGRINFGHGKINILRYMAIIDALVTAANEGDFACGPQASGGFDNDAFASFIMHYAHPSESLEVTLQDGRLLVSRTDGGITSEDSITTTGDGNDNEGTEFDNIVFARPISSCLRKVTGSEANQVEQWIRQLD